MEINQIVINQREYFYLGETRSYKFRIDALKSLKNAIKNNEELLYNALKLDLNKPKSESYFSELGIVYEEISYHIKHLKGWMKDKKVKTPLAQFWSKSYISSEPYGVVLIISPWNYPVQLCLSPLVGAISSGNCVVLKPSAYAPNVSSAINKIISETFDSKYIKVIEGGREQNNTLLEQKFDYIFFTGSVNVGKIVIEKASKNLTPVTLELGGKSPVIVDETANIEVSARRICFGKILNAGQTCVAPDYAFIHESKVEEFVKMYKKALDEFFKNGSIDDFPHIINQKHFDRLLGLLENQKAVIGGNSDSQKRYIEPTVLTDVSLDSPIMQEEIFGPILPIISYKNLDECINYINSKPKPLAFYLFTKSKKVEQKILNSCSFGGGCINDTIIHLATPYMGFGGVGESGMGSYHGKFSFDTFSHKRSIVNKHYKPDLPMRYRPYSDKKDKFIKKFLK